jgi:hypothetical protein
MLPGPFTALMFLPTPGLPAEERPRMVRGPMRLTFLKPGDPYDIDLAALGTTPDQPALRLTVEAPLDWQGYTFVLFGTYERPDSPANATRFALIGSGGSAVVELPIIAWRRQVYCAATPLYVEACWTPQDGETLAIRGFEKDRRKQSLRDHAEAALNLLMTVEGQRDPRPSLSGRAFWERYYDKYQEKLTELERIDSRLPTKLEVATLMLISPKTFKRLRDRYSIPWPPSPPPWRLAQ